MPFDTGWVPTQRQSYFLFDDGWDFIKCFLSVNLLQLILLFMLFKVLYIDFFGLVFILSNVDTYVVVESHSIWMLFHCLCGLGCGV